MDRHRRVAEHRLGPRGRHRDDLAGLDAGLVHDRVIEVPEMALHLDLQHFEVGDRGLELRVPVHQPLVAVDQPLRVEIDEGLGDGADHLVVGGPRHAHGEALARPVAGGAEPLQLVDDGPARLRLPGPDLLDEGRTAEFAPAGLAGLRQAALHHHLGGDAGMVRARLPEHVAPAHALEAAEDVLQGVVEGVPHVQAAGHVRRRDHHGEGRRPGSLRPTRLEGAARLPGGGNARLDGGGVEGLVHHGRGRFTCWISEVGPLSTRRALSVNTRAPRFHAGAIRTGFSDPGRRARSRHGPAARPCSAGSRRASP